MTGYFAPKGGLPPQTQLMTGRAVFTDAYAFIPQGVFSDIVTSFLPGWTDTRLWIIARPMSGFAETFSQYIVELAPGGGSDALEWESEASVGGAKARTWLRTKANSIEGGTSEVMLNVIAKRILELPGG